MLHPRCIKLVNYGVCLRRDRPRPGPPAPVRRDRDASMIGERPADPQASVPIRSLLHQSQHPPGAVINAAPLITRLTWGGAPNSCLVCLSLNGMHPTPTTQASMLSCEA